jgi:protein-tyrosine phosphatase
LVKPLDGPIRDVYWVTPGKFMAGGYPGTIYVEDAGEKLRWLIGEGVTAFVDLTEDDELKPYSGILADEASKLGKSVKYLRWPIPDMTPPDAEAMVQGLNVLDAALNAGEVLYVHCMAGMGRTGAVVGCWLVRGGMTGDEALDEIARLRKGLMGGPGSSPYTAEQREMVRDWPE